MPHAWAEDATGDGAARAALSRRQDQFLRTVLADHRCPKGFSEPIMTDFYLRLVAKRAHRIAYLANLESAATPGVERAFLRFVLNRPETWRMTDEDVAVAFAGSFPGGTS